MAAIQVACANGDYIDITTTGRRTGQPRRIELNAHWIDDRLWLSGLASRRKRSWVANLETQPRMTFHLKGQDAADLPATGRVVEATAERAAVIPHVAAAWGRRDVQAMIELAPLVEVVLDEVRLGWTAGPDGREPESGRAAAPGG
jgi:deazaflavin-dependent oxidoreductase (nitroreductase family)